MGLRLKLGLYVVACIGVVLTLSGFFSIRAERKIYQEEMRIRGVTLLKSFAIPATIAMANNDISTLDNYVVEFSEDAQSLDLAYMAVLDYSGRVVAHTTAGEFGKIYDDPMTREALGIEEPISRIINHGDTSTLEVAVPVISGLRWGTIRAGFSLSRVESATARSRNRFLMTGLFVSLGAGTIAYLVLSLMVIRPVVRMSEMTRLFGAGALEARLRLNQEDEMGQLAVQLNSMADQIQDHTVALERKVDERTGELGAANEQLRDANKQLERLARTDPLTGLYNRRQFVEQLQFEIRRGTRTMHEFALIILDVDNFKHYNDVNGHTAGDELLQRLAALMEINLRATDLVSRYGGEEFVILLLDTGPEEGYATALKLQQVVAAQPMPFEEKQPKGRLTVSVGVSFYPKDSVDGRTLIEYADQALYVSKGRGRNSVTKWEDVRASG